MDSKRFFGFSWIISYGYETQNLWGDEIKLADNFVKDLLSKEDVSVVYVKEVKTLSQIIVYKG